MFFKRAQDNQVREHVLSKECGEQINEKKSQLEQLNPEKMLKEL